MGVSLSLSLFIFSFSSRAKVAAADGPPGIPTQTLIPVRHTVKIDKDALLQDYGFHISESLPLTVVAVTPGRRLAGKLERSLASRGKNSPGSLYPVTQCRKCFPRKLERARLNLA